MSRSIDELAAAIFDVVPGPLLLLLLILVPALAGTLWYWYPAWIPAASTFRRAPSKGRVKKAAKKKPADEPEPVITAAEEEPAPAVPQDLLLADRLAAEGRFAEAVRQRLRDVIRDLVTAGVLAPQPGWTVTELAALAATQRPGLAWPFGAATELFSQIWYAAGPAGRAQDDRMRELTDQVRGELRVTR